MSLNLKNRCNYTPQPNGWALWACFASLWLTLPVHAASPASLLQMDYRAFWKDQELPAAVWPVQPRHSSPLRLHRLEFLVSELALQRPDGSWLESSVTEWQAFVSLSRPGASVIPPATGLPAERFQRIRFKVGLPASLNDSDPAVWPHRHPLHPDTSGLHWGWQGGYVFLALEGRWQRPGDGSPLGGFSFHIATPPRAALVELPISLHAGGPLTLRLGLDIHRLLGAWDFARDGSSTHSRPGDPVAVRLQGALASAFRLVEIVPDTFQPELPLPSASNLASPPGTTPYRLDISRRLPQLGLPPDNPLTHEGVALGKQLFHDPRLSVNNTQSCAACHAPASAFSDSRRLSLGAEGQLGKRQSMPLFNLGWSSRFFWDGRAASLRQQVLMPIQDPHEMNETMDRAIAKIEDLSPVFQQAFGTPDITPDRLARALEQYLLTLVSQDSRFDRAARKVASLTEEEKRGLQLFVTEHDPKRGLLGADCFHCHGGTLFTDHSFRNNGLQLTADDLGHMIVTGNPADRGKFKTPSLRNIALTAPYMHDGRFQTLEEVVAHYSGPMQRSETLDPNLAKHPQQGLNLSPADQRALVAFLHTLTDTAWIDRQTDTQARSQTAQTQSAPLQP